MNISFTVDLLSLILQTGLYIFLNPLFWLVIVFIYFQTKKLLNQEASLYGLENKRRLYIIKYLFYLVLLGLIGGFIGSLSFVLIGVTLSDIGIGYLWLIAILGLLINARFLCFSYAGGIVALSSIFLGWPEVNVPAILVIVAVLHMIESILIYLNGADRPLPLTLHKKGTGTVGGFVLQKLWPIPFVALIALTAAEREFTGTGVLEMPDWWPLMDTVIKAGPGEMIMYFLLPVAAGLGYGDLAISSKPVKRARNTSSYLFLYSLILLGLALAGVWVFPLLIMAAFFSPLGHEIVIKYGLRSELKDQPFFTRPDSGLLVLGVYPDFPAAKAGLQQGDIIEVVDNKKVLTIADFNEYTANKKTVDLSILNGKDKRLSLQEKPSGICFLKEEAQKDLSELTTGKGILVKFFYNILARIKNLSVFKNN